jgi:hypothetical protein
MRLKQPKYLLKQFRISRTRILHELKSFGRRPLESLVEESTDPLVKLLRHLRPVPSGGSARDECPSQFLFA